MIFFYLLEKLIIHFLFLAGLSIVFSSGNQAFILANNWSPGKVSGMTTNFEHWRPLSTASLTLVLKIGLLKISIINFPTCTCTCMIINYYVHVRMLKMDDWTK